MDLVIGVYRLPCILETPTAMNVKSADHTSHFADVAQ